MKTAMNLELHLHIKPISYSSKTCLKNSSINFFFRSNLPNHQVEYQSWLMESFSYKSY